MEWHMTGLLQQMQHASIHMELLPTLLLKVDTRKLSVDVGAGLCAWPGEISQREVIRVATLILHASCTSSFASARWCIQHEWQAEQLVRPPCASTAPFQKN